MAWASRKRKVKSGRNLTVKFYRDHDALIAEAVKAALEAQEALMRQQKILVQLRDQLGHQLKERQSLADRHLKERQDLEITQTSVSDLENRQLQERLDLEEKQGVGGISIIKGES